MRLIKHVLRYEINCIIISIVIEKLFAKELCCWRLVMREE